MNSDEELPRWSDEEDVGTSATEEEPSIAHCHDTPKKKSSRAKERQVILNAGYPASCGRPMLEEFE